MKKAFMIITVMAAIIAVRMILSVTCSEQAAEVFCRISLSFLFFYAVCKSVNYQKAKKKQ